MALRITKKEKAFIYSKNASVRKKQKRLKDTFNITAKFKIKNPTEFKTRQEINLYKQDIKRFLLRGTHAYVAGGIVSRYFSEKGIEVPYAIPKDEYLQIKRILKKRNEQIKKQARLFKKVKYSTKGKKSITSLASRVAGSYQPQGKLLYKYSSYRALNIRPEFITSKATWKKFEYAIKKYQSSRSLKEKQQRMFDNYIRALRNTFGANAEPLVNLLSKLTLDEFITYFESEEYSDFTYIYDETEALYVLDYMTSHLVNFVEQISPKHVTNNDVKIASNFIGELSWVQIDNEYNKGSMGGKRIFLDDHSYIDLSKEEFETLLTPEVLMGANKVTNIEGLSKVLNNPNLASRVHYIKINRKDKNYERNNYKDIL